jgi:putative phage-type endonuclease
MLNTAQKTELSKGIGASESAIVLGISPYCTPFELWLEKTGRREHEDISQKPHVMMGNLLEPVIAKRYSQITGKKLVRVNAALHHKKYPHILCHLDRKVVGQRKLVEIKTAHPFSNEWGDDGSDHVPLQYVAQVQHQFACSGYEEGDLIVYRGTTDQRIYPIERNERVIDNMIEKLNHFWFHHVLDDIAPEVTTRRDVLLQNPTNDGNFIVADNDVYQILAKIAAIKPQAKLLDEELEQAQFELIKLIGSNDGIKEADKVIVTFKADKNGKKSLRIK